MDKQIHAVRTYNLSGKLMYEHHHETAEQAYEEYLELLINLKKTLPAGFGVIAERIKNGHVMSCETIIGEA